MRADIGYFSVVHNDYAVGVLHGGYPLRDDEGGRIRELFAESLAYAAVGGSIDSACGIVENDYLRLFQQGTGNTEPLLLTAGDIHAALSELGVIALREAHYEVVGAG